MALKDYIDNYYNHPKYGMVKVLEAIPKSRTRLLIECRDKGIGYDHDRKRYTGVKKPGGWYRGQNYGFEETHEVHKKELTKIARDV